MIPVNPSLITKQFGLYGYAFHFTILNADFSLNIHVVRRFMNMPWQIEIKKRKRAKSFHILHSLQLIGLVKENVCVHMNSIQIYMKFVTKTRLSCNFTSISWINDVYSVAILNQLLEFAWYTMQRNLPLSPLESTSNSMNKWLITNKQQYRGCLATMSGIQTIPI